MAATIAHAIGSDRTRTKYGHWLGSVESQGEANTFRTFSKCVIRADGSGYVQVSRGERRYTFGFGPETKELEVET